MTGKNAQSWHPGKKGHELRAHSIAYPLLVMLEQALGIVMEAKAQGRRREKKLLVSTKAELASRHPPSPSHLPPQMCDITQECGSQPICLTDYLPNSHKDENSISSSIIAQNDWSLNISFFDTKGVEKALAEDRGYIDKKMIFLSNTNKTALSLLVNISRNSSAWICEVQRGFLNYPPTVGDLKTDASVYLYENVQSRQDATVVAGNRAVGRLLQLTALSRGTGSTPKGDRICFQTEILPKGKHAISIFQKGVKKVSIAYVVYW